MQGFQPALAEDGRITAQQQQDKVIRAKVSSMVLGAELADQKVVTRALLGAGDLKGGDFAICEYLMKPVAQSQQILVAKKAAPASQKNYTLGLMGGPTPPQ